MFGIGFSPANPAILRASAGAGPLPVTLGNVEDAVLGITNDDTPGVRPKSFIGLWAGWVTGTSAEFYMNNDYANNVGMAHASLDGSAWGANLDRDAGTGRVTAFSGASDTEHFVILSPTDGFGGAAYFQRTAPVIGGTGTLRCPAYSYCSGDTNFPVGHVTAAHGVTGYTPATHALGSGTGMTRNAPSAAFRGAFTQMTIQATSTARVGISVDGGAPTFLTMIPSGSYNTAWHYTPPDENVHTYHIWANSAFWGGGTVSIGTFQEIQTLAAMPKLHHFGHSWVDGDACVAGGGLAYVDSWVTAARNGYIAGNCGLAGSTIADHAATLVPGHVSASSGQITASDVAMIDLGTNDNPTSGMDATRQTNYTSIINQLLAAGYGTVLCLACVSTTTSDHSPFNASLASLVTGLADSRVIYVDRSAYIAGDTVSVAGSIDAGHPDTTGYRQMDVLNATYLDPYL